MGWDGNQTDIRFDFDGALRLARLMWAEADSIDAVVDRRAQFAADASVGWEGAYALQFQMRAANEAQAAGVIALQLRMDAMAWAAAWQTAMTEQNSRLYARHVYHIKHTDSVLSSIGSSLFGFDTPPEPPPVVTPQAPNFVATATLVHY